MMRVKTAWVFVLGLAAAGCQLVDVDPTTGQTEQDSTACDTLWSGSYTAYHPGVTQLKNLTSDFAGYVVMPDFNNAPYYVGAMSDSSLGKVIVAYQIAPADLAAFASDVSAKGRVVIPGPVLPPNPGGTKGLARVLMVQTIDLVGMPKAATAAASQCP